jgi:hypothetical protein
MRILGAGEYGIVVESSPGRATKLFYGANKDMVIDEYEYLTMAYDILHGKIENVEVVKPYKLTNHPVCFQGNIYLSGFEMEALETPLDFGEQVHCLLGYRGNDVDDSWSKNMSQKISEKNPTRGFFASPQTLVEIWKEEGSTMNLATLAKNMGLATKLLLQGGLLPIGIEWVWSNGKVYLIDFGLCRIIKPYNIQQYLYGMRLEGLGSNIYLPHPGYPYYENFLEGFYS